MIDIIPIQNANVQPWETFKAQSSETELCNKYQITAQQLRERFNEKIKRLTLKRNGFSIKMSQHPGVRSKENQEDKSRFLTVPFDDTLTFDEIEAVIQQTIKELAESIHERQKNKEIVYSGCTLSGFFIFTHDNKKYAMTMQMGDSVLFAITEDGECSSLANTHGFNNPEEEERVLKVILKSTPDNDKIVNDIRQLAMLIRSNPLMNKHAMARYVQKKITQLKDEVSGDAGFPNLNKHIDELLNNANLTREAAIECIHALLCSFNQSLLYLDVNNKMHDVGVTRGFGDYAIQTLGGYSSIPEIKLYELPEGNLLLCAATDGISELLTSDAIAECAKKNLSPVNDFDFMDELLYQAYCLDENFCDNETISALRLSHESLNNIALLSYVLDGHGNSGKCTSKEHVVNVVNKELGFSLKMNMMAAIAKRKAQNNSENSAVINLSFDPLQKESTNPSAACSSVDTSSSLNLPVKKS
ncbi:MAG: PP2C family serine/threonine-protein phosphatase [Legionellales bacterium]|jgi:serine/threonine protein phosphatase PrpC